MTWKNKSRKGYTKKKDRKNSRNKIDSVPSEKKCKNSDDYLVKTQALIYHTMFSGQEEWYGACLDTVAQTTVIGLKQAKVYCKIMGSSLKMKSSNNKYRFGENKQVSLGPTALRKRFQHNMIVTRRIDVVHASAPVLIGLDLLDKYGPYVNNIRRCTMLSETQQWYSLTTQTWLHKSSLR